MICHYFEAISEIASEKDIVLVKELVVNYGEGGLQNGKIVGPKLFTPPPL